MPDTGFIYLLSYSAADVLLHATSSTENGSLVKISIGNALLHLLCTSKRRITSLCGTGIVHEGMEVPRGVEVMVQASNAIRDWFSVW